MAMYSLNPELIVHDLSSLTTLPEKEDIDHLV